MTLKKLAETVKSELNAAAVQMIGEPGRKVQTVAIVCGAGGEFLHDAVRARAVRPAPSDSFVRCGIPGYDEPGRELVADELVVHDDPFSWELTENCAFASRFAYASE